MKIRANKSIIIFLIIIFIDIPFLKIPDIMPDVLGYIGLFICYSLMMEHEKRFGRAQLVALVSFFLQIVFLFNIVTDEPYLLILKLGNIMLDLFMMYFMFNAYSKLLLAHEHRDMVRTTDIGFYAFLVTILLSCFSLVLPTLNLFFTFVNYIVYALVLHIVYQLYKTIRTRLDDFDVDQVPLEFDPTQGGEGNPDSSNHVM